MKKQEFHKLVRDKIPKIIQKDGKRPVYKTLSEKQFYQELKRKLSEEVAEFFESEDVEELADIQTVLEALVASKNVSRSSFDEIVAQKKAKRGGFEQRFFLLHVEQEELSFSPGES